MSINQNSSNAEEEYGTYYSDINKDTLTLLKPLPLWRPLPEVELDEELPDEVFVSDIGRGFYACEPMTDKEMTQRFALRDVEAERKEDERREEMRRKQVEKRENERRKAALLLPKQKSPVFLVPALPKPRIHRRPDIKNKAEANKEASIQTAENPKSIAVSATSTCASTSVPAETASSSEETKKSLKRKRNDTPARQLENKKGAVASKFAQFEATFSTASSSCHSSPEAVLELEFCNHALLFFRKRNDTPARQLENKKGAVAPSSLNSKPLSQPPPPRAIPLPKESANKNNVTFVGRPWTSTDDLILLETVRTYSGLADLGKGNIDWAIVSKAVSFRSGYFRPPYQCCLRFQLAVWPREEGRSRVVDPETLRIRKITFTREEKAHQKAGRRTTQQQSDHDKHRNLMEEVAIDLDAIHRASPSPKMEQPTRVNRLRSQAVPLSTIVDLVSEISPSNQEYLKSINVEM